MAINEGELPKLAFSILETAVLLGLVTDKATEKERVAAAAVVRRLIHRGRLRARQTGARYIVPGAAIEEYLAGHDDPIKHRDSA
jgi:hypothetical protein